MKNLISGSLLFVSLLTTSSSLFAQFPPRPDDHFWRKKIINRIDLSEKINNPLIARESQWYEQYNQYTEKEGLVMALFNGLKQGKFVTYNPDSLNVPWNYDDVLQKVKDIEGSLSGSGDDFDDEESGEGGFDDISGEGEEGGGDEWGFDEGGDFEDSGADSEAAGGGGFGFGSSDFDTAPFENVIEFIEDRIFDKNDSDMYYDIQYIRIIWTDPGETLPDKPLCVFKYKEVMDALDAAQWKNKFNDARYLSMREIFEKRLFNSFITDLSARRVNSLSEAEDRKQQLVEFEHHLWSY